MENKFKKVAFICSGGPFANQTLHLSLDHPYTMVFKLKNWKGRYSNGRTGEPVLHWEAAA